MMLGIKLCGVVHWLQFSMFNGENLSSNRVPSVQTLGMFVHYKLLQFTYCINEHLAVDSGGYLCTDSYQ